MQAGTDPGSTLRDAFFALAEKGAAATEAERAAYVAQVDAFGEAAPAPQLALDGLSVAWHPTRRHKQLRWVEVARLGAHGSLFARPAQASLAHLAAVFVDPRELSLRTFENIVPLDRVLEGEPLDLALGERRKLAERAVAYAFKLSGAGAATLGRLDALGLYLPPLNACSRGGERFLFHSAKLAEALGAAVKQAMPKSLLGGFSHVNPVFRLNRFAPGDAPFHPHFDTPYVDEQRRQASRYTLLVYLTGGAAQEPVLALGAPADVRLAAVEPGTCVVFGQELEHEGRAFDAGDKVFLRTELVFHERSWRRDPAIAKLFSQACYLTGESVFAPELARWADAYFNRVASAHFRGLSPAPAAADAAPALHKSFRGLHFVSNGFDYWFAKQDGVGLVDCAVVALLDYFNCKIADAPFRALCTSEPLLDADGGAPTDARAAGWVGALLARAGRPQGSPVGELDKDALFPPSEEPDGVCCPFHGWSRFDPTRHSEIIDLYDRAQSFARAHVGPAPITMLGEEVQLDPSRFRVEGDKIHVLSREALRPLNFAACWNAGGSPENYLDVDVKLGLVHLLVPPILFREEAGTWHLMFDFFRNSWLVEKREDVVPIPKIRTFQDGGDPDDLDEDDMQPWVDAVSPELVRHGRKKAPNLWWAENTPLMTDLFGEPDDD